VEREHRGAQHGPADDAGPQHLGAAACAGARLHGDGQTEEMVGHGTGGVVECGLCLLLCCQSGVGSRVKDEEGVWVEGLLPWG
jgi:hypothetical protein